MSDIIRLNILVFLTMTNSYISDIWFDISLIYSMPPRLANGSSRSKAPTSIKNGKRRIIRVLWFECTVMPLSVCRERRAPHEKRRRRWRWLSSSNKTRKTFHKRDINEPTIVFQFRKKTSEKTVSTYY